MLKLSILTIYYLTGEDKIMESTQLEQVIEELKKEINIEQNTITFQHLYFILEKLKNENEKMKLVAAKIFLHLKNMN